MEIKTIARLAELMSQHSLTKLEVQDENLTIRLERGVASAPAAAQSVFEPQGTGVSATPIASEADSEPSSSYITSPMPGTFYTAPSPDAAPIVQVGDEITAGSVVCIVEAMKVMNEVKSEISGTVSQILVKDGSPVEFGQPLFEIIP